MLSSRQKNYIVLAIAVSISSILCYVFWSEILSFLELFSDPSKLRSTVQSYGEYGLLILFALQIAQVILAPVPGQVVGVAFGSIYGPWLGAFLGTIGNTVATAIIVLLTKKYGRPLVERLTDDDSMNEYQKMIRNADVYPFMVLVVLPVIPDDVVCYAAGLSPVDKYRLIIGLSLARIPGMITLAVFGNSIVDFNWRVIIIVGIPVLALIIFVIWKREEIFEYLEPEE